MSGVVAYPLAWPAGWPRTTSSRRSQFGRGSRAATLTVARARRDAISELRRLGASSIVISSNVELRLDGLPYSNRRAPDDPGVAVYFLRAGRQQCIPCDRWKTVEENLRAIALSVAALRGLERWGAKSMVDAAFAGFKTLPERAVGRPWWEIIGCSRDAGEDEIRDRYRCEAMARHPDRGGSHEAFVELQQAFRQALAAMADA